MHEFWGHMEGAGLLTQPSRALSAPPCTWVVHGWLVVTPQLLPGVGKALLQVDHNHEPVTRPWCPWRFKRA